MKLAQAQIFVELLTNAGYLDNAEELLADRIANDDLDVVMQFARDMDEMIIDANDVLPDDEKVNLHGCTMVQTVERLQNR